jgi:hypothetical protein
LVTSASRTRYTDESEGVTWQGYLLGGDLVPSLGWRKDKITNYQSNAITDPNTGYTSLSYPDNLQSRTDAEGTSKTWGGVYHFPKSLMEKLPGDLTFSVLFNRSENFKPDAARLDLDGNPIPNATGTTSEYGFVTTALADKISLKVDWFKTTVKNASSVRRTVTRSPDWAPTPTSSLTVSSGDTAGRRRSRTVSAATSATVSRA